MTIHLWEQALSPRDDDPHAIERERLRVSLRSSREHVTYLAGEINRDLPEFTIHDINHLDALWETASEIAGPDFNLNPLEAWVFGIAALVHDLGMGLAAYPGGLSALKADPRWPDSVALYFRQEHGRLPSEDEIASPPDSVTNFAKGDVLRFRHAEKAADLPLISWQSSGRHIYLIDDEDLRVQFGSLIGQIGASHHWDIDDIVPRLGAVTRGSLPSMPEQWTIDPVLIACLLRVADAAQLDARRAPAILRSIRTLGSVSSTHWAFQEHLLRPKTGEDGGLLFTSARPFDVTDADAWFLCYDTLEMINGELAGVNELLTRTHRRSFKANHVFGVGSYSRICECIPTNGSEPVDTRLRVSDVTTLVERLGGEELYGPNKLVPVRELIQNANDAIRARRLLEERSADWGEVIVRLGNDIEGNWIEVEDNGIGMSSRLLTGPLLDFAKSYWSSELAREESPGLIAKGFVPTGHYGIGFFSVFMLGRHVRVTSRRAEDARSDTHILEFLKGARGRPLLREAPPSEQLLDGGTRVRVWIEGGISVTEAVRPSDDWDTELGLARLCAALDVNLSLETGGERKAIVIANDWKRISARELLQRLLCVRSLSDIVYYPEDEKYLEESLRDIYEDDELIGRATPITPMLRGQYNQKIPRTCLVTVGGLEACYIHSFHGLLIGTPTRASRDLAIPVIGSRALSDWASSSADYIANEYNQASGKRLDRFYLTGVIYACGGATGNLPIAQSSDGDLTFLGLVEWAKTREQIIMVDENDIFPFDLVGDYAVDATLDPDVILVTRTHSVSITSRIINMAQEWPSPQGDHPLAKTIWEESIGNLVFQAIAGAWGLSTEGLLLASDIAPPFWSESMETRDQIDVAMLQGRHVGTREASILRRHRESSSRLWSHDGSSARCPSHLRRRDRYHRARRATRPSHLRRRDRYHHPTASTDPNGASPPGPAPPAKAHRHRHRNAPSLDLPRLASLS